MTNKTTQPDLRYEVITHLDEETGDLILPIPPHVLKQLGWKEGDDIDIGVGQDGRIFLKKVHK